MNVWLAVGQGEFPGHLEHQITLNGYGSVYYVEKISDILFVHANGLYGSKNIGLHVLR